MINNVVLTGRLTAAPELKTTQSGVTVTAFCVAVDRRFKAQDGNREADFVNCVAWRNTAEFICKYFGKGDMIAVVGAIQTRKYKDKDGNNRVAFEVIVNEASFCGGNNNGNNAQETQEAPATTNFEEIGSDDELPF